MMSRDLTDAIGVAVGRAARDVIETTSAKTRKRSMGPLSGATGLAAGAGLATLVPLAGKGAAKLVRKGFSSNGAGPIEKVGDKLSGTAKEAVSGSIEKAGGAGGIAKDAVKGAIPGVGGGDGDSDSDDKSKGVPGVGKGRRMPIQQSADIPAPVQTVYNQFTQFEEWPEFMHRVQRVTQEDETTVSFQTKIWGKSKEFKAEIVEQRPDERIKWRVTEGMTHEGVVTFHELADRLTRVEVSMDVQPGSLIEKAARGMRHIKRAVRADLARFKAYIAMKEEEDGAWRGEIDDGEVKSSARGSSSSAGRGRSGSSGSRSRSGSSGSRSRAASSRSGSRSSGSSRSGSSSGSSRSGSSSGSSRSGSSSGSSRSGSSSGSSRSSRSGSSSGSSRSRSSRGSSRSGSSNGSSRSGASNGSSRSGSRARSSSRS
jgi:uncharacterized membrane protein